MIVEITIEEKIKKRFYFNEINDFWLNLNFSCFCRKTAEKLKEVVLTCSNKEGANEVTKLIIDGISYQVNVITRNGSTHTHECSINTSKLPEEIEKDLKYKSLKSLIFYNKGYY